MRALRKALFWCHLAAGAVAGAVILVLCATGVLLAFQPQVLRLVERPGLPASAPSGERLGAGTLLRLAGEASPGDTPTAVTVSADRAEPAAVAFGRERALFMDVATGAVVGSSSRSWRAFFAKTQDLHRWLAFGEKDRAAGKAVTGAANVAFLGLALSGLYIWWPRLRGIRRAASVALFQRGIAGKARDFNWHNVIGVWSALPLLVITVTALPMSYRWAGDLVYRLAGSEPPPASSAADRNRAGAKTSRTISTPSAQSLDRLWNVAERQSPGWKAITLRVPSGAGAPVAFTIEEGRFLNRFARSQLTLDASPGPDVKVVKWEPYAEANAGRQARSWMRFLHTGEALGPAGQLLAAAASLGGTFLVVTGLALAFRRFQIWRARLSSVTAEISLPKTPTQGDDDVALAKGTLR